MPEALFPLFLDLRNKPVLVVGAGTVAASKLQPLLAAGAVVTVVAPVAVPEIAALADAGQLRWQKRRFRAFDLSGVWLAVAATSDRAVTRRARLRANSA